MSWERAPDARALWVAGAAAGPHAGVRRRCWIVRPYLHPVTAVLACVALLVVAVCGLLGFFLLLFLALWALYTFYI